MVRDDSRRVEPGDTFVAVRGYREDGNRFITEALARGARHVFTDQEGPWRDARIHWTPDARRTLAWLAAAEEGLPAFRLVNVGVTGTNGKTTTTTLIQWLLNWPGKRQRAGLIGTVAIDNGAERRPTPLTTPAAPDIQRHLAVMLERGLTHAVIEVSSHGLKLSRVEAIPFGVAVFTNLTPDHFDLHPSLEDYVATKASLFQQLSERAWAVVNHDDPYGVRMLGVTRAQRLTYGLHQDADLRASDVRLTPDGARFRLSIKHVGTWPVATRLLGHHNVSNVLAGLAAGLAMGLPVPAMLEACAAFPPLWRRLEVRQWAGVTVIDDCCHNPDGYAQVLETVGQMSFRRVMVVNAIRGNRGVKINQLNSLVLAETLRQRPDWHLWLTDCQDTALPVDRVAREEREACTQVLSSVTRHYRHTATLDQALHEAASLAGEGDLLLLLGPHAMDRAADLLQGHMREARPAAALS